MILQTQPINLESSRKQPLHHQKHLRIIPLEIKRSFGLRILQPVGNDFVRRLRFFPGDLPDDVFFAEMERLIPHDLLIWNYFYEDEKNKIKTARTRWFRFASELIIELPPSTELYFSSLERRMRRNLFRRISNIERDLGTPALIKASPEETGETLALLFELNKEVFSHKVYDSVFNHSEYRDYFTGLTEGLDPRAYRLYSLSAGGKTLAIRLAYITGDTLQLRIPGYDYDYRKYSLSHSLLKFIVEDAHAEGIRKISFMRGNESFKYDWNPVEYPRYRLFRYRHFCHYLYYTAALSASRELPRLAERICRLFKKRS